MRRLLFRNPRNFALIYTAAMCCCAFQTRPHTLAHTFTYAQVPASALAVGYTKPPASAPAQPPPVERAATPQREPHAEEKRVTPFEGVTVILNETDRALSRIEVAATTCLDSGWLEQAACSPGTREHESLVVVKTRPSHIHAALLMAGFEPGKPGRWIYENDRFDVIKPEGEKVRVRVRYVDSEGAPQEHDIGKWIREAQGQGKPHKAFPAEPFIFGGSRIEKNPPLPSGEPSGEHYVADKSGSIIGLVTFGDEMIGFSVVRSDQDAVQEPTWEIDPAAMPPVGTEVTLIISRWKP